MNIHLDVKKEILADRIKINFLVKSFYSKIRQDDILGPIFNNHIADWPDHIERLTDFWETNLLFVRNFKGNPKQKHIELDSACGHSITQEHFGRWLQLWFQTLDEYYVGENVSIAKNRARNMASFFFLQIFKARTT